MMEGYLAGIMSASFKWEGQMKRLFAVGMLAFFGLAVAAYAADDWWVKKDWKEWTESDCKKILQDSPWAKRVLVEHENNAGHLPSASKDTGVSTDVMASAQNSGTGEINYFFQFRSAEPIRHAYMRQQQLQQNYAGMNADQKKAFDTKIEDLVKTPPPDVIALHVTFTANRTFLAEMVADTWKRMEPGKVPKDFYLITDKGVHVAPSSFSFTEGVENEFDITFPRTLNGEPIFGPGAKSIKIQFVNPAMGDFGADKKTFEFKLDKMMLDGKLVF
jgi:hypothetical protein